MVIDCDVRVLQLERRVDLLLMGVRCILVEDEEDLSLVLICDGSVST